MYDQKKKLNLFTKKILCEQVGYLVKRIVMQYMLEIALLMSELVS